MRANIYAREYIATNFCRMEWYGAALIVIVILLIVLHMRECHVSRAREGLHCDCARTIASQGVDDASLPLCPERYVGQLPFGNPGGPRACRRPEYNPFWPPHGAAGAYVGAGDTVDIPISRMIGDHVPME